MDVSLLLTLHEASGLRSADHGGVELTSDWMKAPVTMLPDGSNRGRQQDNKTIQIKKIKLLILYNDISITLLPATAAAQRQRTSGLPDTRRPVIKGLCLLWTDDVSVSCSSGMRPPRARACVRMIQQLAQQRAESSWCSAHVHLGPSPRANRPVPVDTVSPGR